jgi:hypothetical protein
MPNDCYNIIDRIHHADPAQIARLEEMLSRENPAFFEEWLPCPPDEDPVSYWGTKWDVYGVAINVITEDTLPLEESKEAGCTQLELSFYTPWTPPLAAYARLKEKGFTIDAIFMESGMDFCGYWRDGITTTFYDASHHLDTLPEEFHFYFCDGEDEAGEDEDGDDEETPST